MDLRARILMGLVGVGAPAATNDHVLGLSAELWQPPAPDTLKHADVLGPVKARPCGWPRKTRPALTGPARVGCEIWRSGRKNARGTGRTKECIQENGQPRNWRGFRSPAACM